MQYQRTVVVGERRKFHSPIIRRRYGSGCTVVAVVAESHESGDRIKVVAVTDNGSVIEWPLHQFARDARRG